MITDLECECCGGKLSSDFSVSVWCTDEECLLHNKCYSRDFIEGRKLARENGEKVQTKERMCQGWAFEPGFEKEALEPEIDYPELKKGVLVSFLDSDDTEQTGVIDSVTLHHVKIGWRTLPKHYVTVKKGCA